MSSICGYFFRDGHPEPPETIQTMACALNHWQGDSVGTWRNASGSVAMGHVKLANTPESLAEVLPFFHASSGVAITADARIDNRDELFVLLDIPPPHRPTMPDSQLILEAYRKWGRDCCGHLLGDFAFAIWDDKEKRLFCARDQLGNKPLFYFKSGDAFLFATEMKGIFAARDLPRTLNPQWIADALTVSAADMEYTFHPDVWRLPPAHWFSVSATEFEKGKYWSLDPEREIHLSSEDDYVEAFRELLTEAVRCRMRSAFPVGSELSGGLDSSAVTALAAQIARAQNVKLTTFSQVLDEADRNPSVPVEDESQYQGLLRRHAGITNAVEVTSQGRGIIESMKRTLFVQDGPPLRSFGTFFDVLYETGEKEGVRTLLSGFGGDEGVSSPARGRLDELARQREWRALWREFRQKDSREAGYPFVPFLGKVAGECVPFFQTVYGKFRDKRLAATQNAPAAHMRTFPISPEFYQAADVQRRLAAIPKIGRDGRVRNSQYRRLLSPQTLLRLECCSLATASHRLEYRYPLLDVRLLEFHLAVPSGCKRKNGYGRYLFRRAVAGIVPPEIQWRTDKCGATNPAVPQRFARDWPAIENLIAGSQKNQGAYYLDLEHLLKQRDFLEKRKDRSVPVRQGAFSNALLLLLYFQLDSQAKAGRQE